MEFCTSIFIMKRKNEAAIKMVLTHHRNRHEKKAIGTISFLQQNYENGEVGKISSTVAYGIMGKSTSLFIFLYSGNFCKYYHSWLT